MKKIILTVLILIITTLHSNISFADQNKNIDHITKNLRCLICQGQSVYDSQSDFALSMKKLIQIKIKEGNTEDEIYKFLKEKYGEWIVFKPQLNIQNSLLWILPYMALILGGFFIIKLFNKKNKITK